MTGDNKKGFTLVELLVGITIFSLTVMVAVSLFAKAMENQRKGIAIQNVSENGRFLMWHISKEIRFGLIENSSDGESSQLTITHPDHGEVIYSFSDGEFLRSGKKLNSDEVYVTGKFIIDGKTFGDNQQPRVTVAMQVLTSGTKGEEASSIFLQTTFSQYNIYLY